MTSLVRRGTAKFQKQMSKSSVLSPWELFKIWKWWEYRDPASSAHTQARALKSAGCYQRGKELWSVHQKLSVCPLMFDSTLRNDSTMMRACHPPNRPMWLWQPQECLCNRPFGRSKCQWGCILAENEAFIRVCWLGVVVAVACFTS